MLVARGMTSTFMCIMVQERIFVERKLGSLRVWKVSQGSLVSNPPSQLTVVCLIVRQQ